MHVERILLERTRYRKRRNNNHTMSEILEFVIVSMVLVAIGIYGLVVKRNTIRMLFSIEIIANAPNLLLVTFSRGLPNAQGQVVALFAIAIAGARSGCGSWAYHSSIQAIQRD